MKMKYELKFSDDYKIENSLNMEDVTIFQMLETQKICSTNENMEFNIIEYKRKEQ